MARNAASLSVADAIRRVKRLSVVSRSARSSARWNSRAGGLAADRAAPVRLRRPALLNVEMQARVRLAERLFDGGGRLAPGEDESEILPALGKRDHLLARVHRDGDFLDGVDRRGLLDTAHRGEPP